MLTTTGRRVRAAATAVGLALVVAGTAWGHDDHFPFGPFRMYARATQTTGRVSVAAVQGVTADGAVVELDAGDLGFRRAELEGQLPRFRRDPALLGHLATAYERHTLGAPALVEVRLVSKGRALARGDVGPERARVLAVWRRS